MTQVEWEIVMDMLHTCEDPPVVEVETLDHLGAASGEHKPTPETGETVYESCEEAAEAGEERVQGSQGGGEGFPAEMIPNARDGDGTEWCASGKMRSILGAIHGKGRPKDASGAKSLN